MSRGDLREVFSTLDALRGQRDGLSAKCDRLERDLRARDDDVVRLSADNAALRAKEKRLSEDLHARDTQLAQATALLHVAQSSLRELSAQYDRLRSTASEAATVEVRAAPQPRPPPPQDLRRGSTASLASAGGVEQRLALWPRAASDLQASLHEARRNDVALQATRHLVDDLRGVAAARDAEAAALRTQLRRQAAGAVATSLLACLSRRAHVNTRRAFDGLLMHARHAWTLEAARAQGAAQLRAVQERAAWTQRSAVASRAVHTWLSTAVRGAAARTAQRRAAEAVVRLRLTSALRLMRGAVARRHTLERLAAVAVRAQRRQALVAWRAGAVASVRSEQTAGARRLELQLGRACDLVGRRHGARAALSAWRARATAARVEGMRRRVRLAFASITAAAHLAASRRTARRVLDAFSAALAAQRLRRRVIERMLRRTTTGQLRAAWGVWRQHAAAEAVEAAQHGVAGAAVARRAGHRQLRSHWLAWVGVWLRRRRLEAAAAKVRAVVTRTYARRGLRVWGAFAAASAARAAGRRHVDVALLALLRRRLFEERRWTAGLGEPGSVPTLAGPTGARLVPEVTSAVPSPPPPARTPHRAPADERGILQAWIGWRGALRERRAALAARATAVASLARAAAVAGRATQRTALRSWFSRIRDAQISEARATSTALLAQQDRGMREAAAAVQRALGRWRRRALVAAQRRRTTHLGQFLGRRIAARARGVVLRAWAAAWRASASLRARSSEAALAQDTAAKLRQKDNTGALAGALARWGALSARLGARGIERARSVAALGAVLDAASQRRSSAAASTSAMRWAFSRWAQALLAGQATAALEAERWRAAEEQRALHETLRLCLRASVVGTSARSLCLAVSSLSGHPELSRALGGPCRVVLWLVDAAKRTMRTAGAGGGGSGGDASGLGLSSVTGLAASSTLGGSRRKSGSGGGSGSMFEAPVGAGLAGAAAAHFLGLEDMTAGQDRSGRSLLVGADGETVIGAAVTDALRDAAYDSALDSPLRSLLDEAAAADGGGGGSGGTVSALLLPCIVEGSGAKAAASRGPDGKRRAHPDGAASQLIGVLVVGLSTPPGGAAADPRQQLYVADALAAACAAGVSRVLAHARTRHVEAAAADAVQRAHRQLKATGLQVGAPANLCRALSVRTAEPPPPLADRGDEAGRLPPRQHAPRGARPPRAGRGRRRVAPSGHRGAAGGGRGPPRAAGGDPRAAPRGRGRSREGHLPRALARRRAAAARRDARGPWHDARGARGGALRPGPGAGGRGAAPDRAAHRCGHGAAARAGGRRAQRHGAGRAHR